MLVASAAAANQWPVAGGLGARHFAPLADLTPANVAGLTVAWEYSTGEVARRGEFRNWTAKVELNPVLLPPEAGGHLMICTPFARVIALDPASGKERWVYDPGARIGGYATAGDPQGLKSPSFANCRGVAWWHDAEAPAGNACRNRVLLAAHDLKLHAVDAANGRPCEGFGRGGVVDVEPEVLGATPPADIGETKFPGPPLVVNDVVVVGTSVRDFDRASAPDGAVRAFDARSGAPRWRFDPIPRDAALAAALGWPAGAAERTGGGNVWGMMSADEERDLVFLPTSGPSPDFYGGTRPGDNRYADSIVALRGATGEVVWHFQTIHHDVWDYDNSAQPALVDLSRDGAPFPAVVQATKTGMLYIFHRETGEPFFPIEERPVPQGGVPGESLSPTQPFPVKPPPLVPHTFSDDDFWGITPWERSRCVAQYRNARRGAIFTPPSLEGTIVVPSTAGGVNWGGVAIDPRSGLLVVNVLRMAHYAQLIPAADMPATASGNIGENMLGAPGLLRGTPYALKQQALMAPPASLCSPPPYAELVAVDLNRGEILWRSTLGIWDRNLPPPMARAPFSIPLPLKWGTPTFGGPLLTAGGLVFIGATGDDLFRAFDAATGRELWQDRLPTSAFSLPMSYETGGRQYVVVAAGGHAFIYNKPGDLIRAYALPARRP
ncbi:MAG: pyrroloquinoline quinone-dependent dehydrogenase [Gammaproteobacteria bacterium]|nr:pyrroloquinoline quinone-dependent dehydrogenase [Gammaproteobacteria bacterium]